MRRILHLLVAMAVLMCGMHVGEASAAHADAAHGIVAAHDMAPDHDRDAAPEKPAKALDAGHHHCPVALDPQHGASLWAAFPEAILVAGRFAAMPSLAQPPLIEPPLA